MAMSSNYNARPRACEVIVDASAVHQVRKRERIDELYALEAMLPK
jgi:diaminopimelate decarboxylase